MQVQIETTLQELLSLTKQVNPNEKTATVVHLIQSEHFLKLIDDKGRLLSYIKRIRSEQGSVFLR